MRSFSLRVFREARASLRLARAVLHLAGGLAMVLALYPALEHRARAAVSRHWTADLLRILGIELRLAGAAAPHCALLVANHVSWLDVLVINSVCPATFVSKREVGAWPAIGVLLARAGTVMLRRGDARAARNAASAVAGLAVGYRREGSLRRCWWVVLQADASLILFWSFQ